MIEGLIPGFLRLMAKNEDESVEFVVKGHFFDFIEKETFYP